MFFKSKKEKGQVKVMSQSEAKKLLEQGGITLVDVRTVVEYKDGHIKNSILLPLNQLASNETAVLSDKNAKIFVYCLSGGRSARAASTLVKMGYTDVTNIGGIATWSYGTTRD